MQITPLNQSLILSFPVSRDRNRHSLVLTKNEMINSLDGAISLIDKYLRLSENKHQSNIAEIEEIVGVHW